MVDAAHGRFGSMERGMSLRSCAAAFGLAATMASAQAADLPGPIAVGQVQAENPCGDAAVLERIAERFSWADAHTWHRGVSMAVLGNARDGNHPYYEPGLIRRQYCVADAVLTNQDRRTVYYAIEYGQGFASIGNRVQFCVLGLDPWHIHDADCRTVR
jgi:hypothetical protein